MKIAFVTIGQSPRNDLVPFIVEHLRSPISVTEFGVLDDLTEKSLVAMTPDAHEPVLVSRLRNGNEIYIKRQFIAGRLLKLVQEIDKQGFDFIVLLCTGHFPEVEALDIRTPLMKPQKLMDGLATSLLVNARQVAIVVPNAKQMTTHPVYEGVKTVKSWISPYTGRFDDESELARLDQDLSGSDLIVMHCVGYNDSIRAVLRARYHCPVLIPRRVISAAIDIISP